MKLEQVFRFSYFGKLNQLDKQIEENRMRIHFVWLD